MLAVFAVLGSVPSWLSYFTRDSSHFLLPYLVLPASLPSGNH